MFNITSKAAKNNAEFYFWWEKYEDTRLKRKINRKAKRDKAKLDKAELKYIMLVIKILSKNGKSSILLGNIRENNVRVLRNKYKYDILSVDDGYEIAW